MSALPYGLESDSEGIQLNEVFFALGSISCKTGEQAGGLLRLIELLTHKRRPKAFESRPRRRAGDRAADLSTQGDTYSSTRVRDPTPISSSRADMTCSSPLAAG